MISVQKLDQYEQNIKISEEIITRHLQQLLFDAKQSLEINRWVLYEISIDKAIKWLEIYFHRYKSAFTRVSFGGFIS